MRLVAPDQRDALRKVARRRLASARADLSTAQGALEGVDMWLADRVLHTLRRIDQHLRRLNDDDVVASDNNGGDVR